VVDHHATYDDVCQPKRDLPIIDPSASSVALLIHEWAQLMSWPIDLPTAEALLTGIGTDTGWFRFSNTDGRTLQAAARLIDQGVQADVLHTRLYSAYAPARLRLLGEMLNTIRFELNGKLALAELTPEMFTRAGAQPSDAEELVNELMTVGSVVVASLLSLQPDGTVRVNLRSKSPEVAGVDVDVSGIAAGLGGGGHRRAAGTRLQQSLDQARNQVIRGVESAWP
jgi:phosphoesterase RecJ-like protein